MHNRLPFIALLGCISLHAATSAHAHSETDSINSAPHSKTAITQHNEQCSFSFDKDIYASYEELRVQDKEKELLRIRHNGDLWLAGEPVTISALDRGLLIQYKNGITAQSEFMVEVMAEALTMTSYALTTAFGEMFGEKHKIVRRIERLNTQLADDFAMVAYQQNDTYVVQGSYLDEFGDQLSNTLETEIESIVEDSMGSMLWMVTKAMFAGKGSFEQRMEQFGERMEAMGEQLGSTMESWGEQIEQRGEEMCSELARLREIEAQLDESIPDFSDFRLLK